jgi:hypothetical protein
MDQETGRTEPQQRRQALVEFELSRDPTATDQEIAKRSGYPVSSVVAIRAELDD